MNSSGAAVNVTISYNTTDQLLKPYETWQKALLLIILPCLCIGTAGGNALVCIAVGLVKKLQSPSNLLIVSLAVSDLFVGALVMPFAAVYEAEQRWDLGDAFCDAWTSLDVLLCTASIMNLCAISIDRYLVITRPFDYALKRKPSRMGLMILIAWVASAAISIPPVFGWKPTRSAGECIISQDIGYQFYATIFAFYLPLGVMIFIYGKIYKVSHDIKIKEARSQPRCSMISASASTAFSDDRRRSSDHAKNNDRSSGDSSAHMLSKPRKSLTSAGAAISSLLKKKHKETSNREGKAIITLGVIMGAFTACWLPFFILALIQPLCNQCIPSRVMTFFQWLGFINSFLNPFIYARFNTEFRRPFKEILLFRCRGINKRLRSYSGQYD